MIRNSRFLARASSAESPEAALAFLAEIAEPDATHNCWAYRIGEQYRSSDDGEPSGTAGRPILAAIEGQGLDQVVVVVTRWYGGIKLGAGGLVRAYGGTAAECLRCARHAVLVEWIDCTIRFGFADTGAVHVALDSHAAVRVEEHFDARGTRLSLRIAADRLDALRAQLRDATRDRATLHVEGTTSA